MYMSSPVVVGDTVYGFTNRNKGQFFALDVATGKTRWTEPAAPGGERVDHGRRRPPVVPDHARAG